MFLGVDLGGTKTALSIAGLGIGISCGSPQDSLRGIIQAPPNMPRWAV